MNNDQLNTSLSLLERRIIMLLNEYANLKAKVQQLETENGKLQETLKMRDDQLIDFQNRIKISKIVGAIDTEESKPSELKKKIDDYIKEIDKCIVHLSE